MSAACSDLGAELTHLEPPANREGLIRHLHDVLALEHTFDFRIASLKPAPRDATAAHRAATARTLWVPAVNNHGGFGRWTFMEITDPWDAEGVIRSFLDSAKANPL